jgi:hypothetical protein
MAHPITAFFIQAQQKLRTVAGNGLPQTDSGAGTLAPPHHTIFER